MKIIGSAFVKKVVCKLTKKQEGIKGVGEPIFEKGSNVISLQERRAARDAFSRQSEKSKKHISDIYIDDDAPVNIKPLIGPRGGHFDRNI